MTGPRSSRYFGWTGTQVNVGVWLSVRPTKTTPPPTTYAHPYSSSLLGCEFSNELLCIKTTMPKNRVSLGRERVNNSSCPSDTCLVLVFSCVSQHREVCQVEPLHNHSTYTCTCTPLPAGDQSVSQSVSQYYGPHLVLLSSHQAWPDRSQYYMWGKSAPRNNGSFTESDWRRWSCYNEWRCSHSSSHRQLAAQVNTSSTSFAAAVHWITLHTYEQSIEIAI